MSKPNIYLHPSITEQSGFAEICKPLEKLNISYFSHVNIKGDAFAGMCNNPQFFEHYVKNRYYNNDVHMAQVNLGKYIVWDSIEINGKSRNMKEEAVSFGLNSTFTIIQKTATSGDYYHFSTHLPSKSINQIYITHTDVLEAFINYFKEKVFQSKNLSTYLNIKFHPDIQAEGYQLDQNNCSMIDNREKERLLDNLNVKSYNANIIKLAALLDQSGLDATKREKDVLLGLIKGKSARIIAAELNLSSRTVEHYIENIKLKFNVDSKQDLVEKIMMLLF